MNFFFHHKTILVCAKAAINLFGIRKKLQRLCIGLLIPLFFCTAVSAQESLDLFYFNPDSVQFNFSLLKKEVDQFFQSSNFEIRFQAFSQQADFERLITERRPALVLVPAWYYAQHGKTLALTPLLTPLNNGQPSYSKVLLVRSTTLIKTIDIAGKTVASTTMGPKTSEQLGHFFSNGQPVDFSTSHLITTPKDADALFALVLGQVDLAVVGKETIREVGGNNQKILAAVKEIIPSKPMPMPLLCITGTTMKQDEIERLRRTLVEGGNRSPRPSFMTMLQFDGWQNAML
jgi:hypothetical protein